MKKLTPLLLATLFSIALPVSSQEKNIELMNAALFVESRQFIIDAWKDHCTKLNPVKAKYFSSATSTWSLNNSKLTEIANRALADFKSRNRDVYEKMRKDATRSINSELATHDVVERIEHCDTFFRRVMNGKQDIANINANAYTLLTN